jgi:hypothetical protein
VAAILVFRVAGREPANERRDDDGDVISLDDLE